MAQHELAKNWLVAALCCGLSAPGPHLAMAASSDCRVTSTSRRAAGDTSPTRNMLDVSPWWPCGISGGSGIRPRIRLHG